MVLLPSGCPSGLKDVQSVDWAPTVNLGHRRRKPESSQRPEERMKVRGGERRGCEGAEALLTVQQSAESPKPQNIGPTVKEPRGEGTGPRCVVPILVACDRSWQRPIQDVRL